MKRKLNIILFILVAVMCCGLFAMQASAATTASGTCGDNLTWVLDSDGTLTISGTGPMDDFGYRNLAPWYDYIENITKVNVNSGVTSIGTLAFAEATNLIHINISNTVEKLSDGSIYVSGSGNYENDPFDECDSLQSINVDANNKYFSSLDGVLYNKSVTRLIKYPANRQSEMFSCPKTVTEFNDYSFSGEKNLKEITIPSRIKRISNSFLGSSALKKIYTPADSIVVGDFLGTNTSCIDINTNEEITEYTYGQAGYLYYTISNQGILYICGNTSMPDYSRNKNPAPWYTHRYYFDTVIIEHGIETIGNEAFRDCDDVKKIYIPSTVTSVGEMALKCYDLTNIYYDGSKTKWSEIEGAPSSTSSSYIYDCVDFAYNSLTYISDIGENTVFFYEEKLPNSEVIITEKIPQKGKDVFLGWSEEQNADEPTYYGGEVLTLSDDIELYAVWEGIVDRGECGNNIVWTLYDNGTLTISGSGEMTNYTSPASVPWYSYRTDISQVIISDEIIYVSDYAFYNCSNMTSITIPSSVTGIGNRVFYLCTSLTSINVDEKNTNYSSANGVLFNKSKTDLIQYPCGQLRSLYEIPDSVTSIYEQAFSHCTNLTSITIPDSVISIGKDVFYSCTGLTSVTIPNSVTSIGDSAFVFCNNLTSVIIGRGVTNIGEMTFKDCTSLTSVIIPNSVKTIEQAAFYRCTALTDVYYDGMDEEWGAIVIGANNGNLLDAKLHCKYKITYNSNGGAPTPEQQEINYDETINLSTVTPTKEGYDFLGWSTQNDAATPEYMSGSEFSTDSSVILYAVWQIKTYNVTYDANGGTNTPDNQSKIHGEDLTLSSVIPFKEGYIFKGWSSIKDSTTPEYQSGDLFDVNEDTVLYAVWEIKTYTISYDANGGTPTPEPQEVIHGKTIKLSNVIPTKEGYDFIGWSLNSLNCSPGSELYTNSSVTLYAVWQIKTYNVTYDANGGTNAPANQTKTYGVDLSLSNAVPTLEGYTFKGWSTVKDAVAEYQQNSVYSENAELTLYAVWEINTYVITYNANGGIGAPESQKKTHNINLELSTIEPTKTGHIFKGWAISDSSSNVKYYSGDIYEENANVTLYAVWEKEKYTITYNANGGTNAPNSQLQIYEEPLEITNEHPVKDGYTFMGWTYTSSSTVVRYQSGSTYEENRSRTLYAVWKANEYIVEYDANGGSNAPESQTKVHNVDLTLSDSIPSREGHTFIGWSSVPNATSAEYNAAGIYQSNVDVTLYAVWKINTYTISYDVGNGNNAPEAQIKTYGNNLTLSSITPTKEGHTFMGWSTTAIGTVAEYQPNSIFTINADTVLYAVWEINTYTMVYDANGGINAPESQEKTYGIDLTLSSVMPSKEGYTFKGWATTKGGTVEYQPRSIYSENTNVTLYAVWEINTYSIIYDANGGIGAPVSQKKEYGNDFVITSSVPTRDGYAFKGWSLSPESTVVSYVAGSIYSDNKGITLYAVWAKQLTAPTFKVTSFVGGKTIIVTAEQGTIYYTLDGSEPSKNSSIYSGEINLTETAILKAIVMQENCENSSIVEQTIVVDKTGTPELNCDSNSIVEIGTIVKLNSTFDAVYYSVNGNEFVQYTNGIILTDDCTIKLYAINSGSSKSEIVEYVFTIAQSEKPVINVTDVYGGKEISLSANEKDTIYYTLDGSVPDKNSNKYTGKFTVSEDTTITVVALRDEAKISESVTENIVVEKAISPTFSINTDSVMEYTECELYAEGYVIYYTTDGTDPLTSGKIYETPIVLKESVQIKAIAVKLGSAYSDISTRNITVTKLPSITLDLIEDNGDTVKIAAEIAENPGISSALLKLKYPKAALSYIDIEKGTMLNNGICNVHETDDGLNILWINANNSYENGKLFEVNLSRNVNYVADAPISITYSAGDIINDNFDDVNPKLNNASITLSNNTYEYGISTLEKDVVYSSTKVDGKVTLNVQSSEGNKTANLIVAIYNENGKLLNITSNDITLALGNNKAIVDVSATVPETCNSVTVKFLLWESVNSIKPLCAFEEMTISK